MLTQRIDVLVKIDKVTQSRPVNDPLSIATIKIVSERKKIEK